MQAKVKQHIEVIKNIIEYDDRNMKNEDNHLYNIPGNSLNSIHPLESIKF